MKTPGFSCPIRLLVVAIALLLVCACAEHRPYRLCSDAMHPCFETPVQTGAGYSLGFIEFDDQGHLWDSQQATTVVDQIEQAAAEEDLLIVVFVHGWKHNAAAKPREDGNVQSFRMQLHALSDAEARVAATSPDSPGRRVVGVYLGWRGSSLNIPLLDNITFWDRKNTAHKVGQGGVGDILARLNGIRARKLRADLPRSAHSAGSACEHDSACVAAKVSASRGGDTRLIVIGHSFGAAVVYNAVSSMFEQGFHVNDVDKPKQASGYGDLVVLINPAFEAIQFSALSDLAAKPQAYSTGQLPLLVVVASEADQVVKQGFPIGRWFASFWERTRIYTRYNGALRSDEQIDQALANLTALGHFKPYTTHRLDINQPGNPGEAGGSCEPQDLQAPPPIMLAAEGGMAAAYAYSGQRWSAEELRGTHRIGNTRLTRNGSSGPNNPYIVAITGEALIGNHNMICSNDLWEFIAALINLAT